MEYYSNNDWRDYIRSRNELMHYGTPKHSGRYPWGSGEEPYHHGADSPRKRYKERKADIKKAWKDRRRELNDEVYEKEKAIDSHYKRGETLSKEHINEQNKNAMEYAKKWDDARNKYKTDLKSAKEQYRNEKKQEKDSIKRDKEIDSLSKDMKTQWYKAYNDAAVVFNKELESINAKFESGVEDPDYLKAVDKAWRKAYSDALDDRYKKSADRLGVGDQYEKMKDAAPAMSNYSDMLDELQKQKAWDEYKKKSNI